MAQKANSLSHTEWMYKYNIVFTTKYRRKIIYNQCRESLGEILRTLSKYKREIIEVHLMPDHAHMLVSIPSKIAIPNYMGYLKVKRTLMMFDKHTNLEIGIFEQKNIM
ncbi:Transposase and inactivated derivatives [Chlamydia trachomatis]|nr:Transposase and inactivated derivatives [Chlamydia trachomatis]